MGVCSVYQLVDNFPDILIVVVDIIWVVIMMLLMCDNLICAHTKDKDIVCTDFLVHLNIRSVHGSKCNRTI